MGFMDRPFIESSIKKIALIVGHSKLEPGAYSPFLGISEYKLNTNFAQMLCSVLAGDYEPIIYFRDGLTIDGTYLSVSKANPDLSIELHSNSDADDRAFGTEVLCADRVESKAFAELVQKGLCNALKRLGAGDRGVKVLGPKARGYESVKSLSCPNILLEPFFMSNESDCALFTTNQAEVCLMIREAVDQYFRGVSDALGKDL